MAFHQSLCSQLTLLSLLPLCACLPGTNDAQNVCSKHSFRNPQKRKGERERVERIAHTPVLSFNPPFPFLKAVRCHLVLLFVGSYGLNLIVTVPIDKVSVNLAAHIRRRSRCQPSLLLPEAPLETCGIHPVIVMCPPVCAFTDQSLGHVLPDERE